MVASLLIRGAGLAIKGIGKALSKKKKTKKIDKVQKSASDFVKRRKQLSKGKPDLVKQSGPSKKEVIGYGTAAGAGLGATAVIKKKKKK
jgi:hypothetical protein